MLARWFSLLALGFSMLVFASDARAGNLKIEVRVTEKAEIKMDFGDGTKHVFRMVRREGSASGEGILSGANVIEYSAHDVQPLDGSNVFGYLAFSMPSGEIVNVKWTYRVVHVPSKDGKSRSVGNGVWEIVSGTGGMKDLRGAGMFHIKRVPDAKKDRILVLEGDTAKPS